MRNTLFFLAAVFPLLSCSTPATGSSTVDNQPGNQPVNSAAAQPAASSGGDDATIQVNQPPVAAQDPKPAATSSGTGTEPKVAIDPKPTFEKSATGGEASGDTTQTKQVDPPVVEVKPLVTGETPAATPKKPSLDEQLAALQSRFLALAKENKDTRARRAYIMLCITLGGEMNLKSAESLLAEEKDIQSYKSAIALCIAQGEKEHLIAAEAMLKKLELTSKVVQQWVRLQRATIATLMSEPREAADRLREAYKEALLSVPLDVEIVYFTPSNIIGEDGFPLPRVKEQREDAVYHTGDVIQVAAKFRYLRGQWNPEAQKYRYSMKFTAKLYDEQGVEVKNFGDKAVEGEWLDTRAPEDLNFRVLKTDPLPHDIKSNQDYTLKLTFNDLIDKEAPAITKELIVKVRPR